VENNNRSTKQRNLLIECFHENKCRHLTVEELYSIAKAKDEKIGIATIYRNVKFLEEQGIIKKVSLPNALPCYELCTHEHEHSHHHLICRICGSILDFEDDLLEPIERIIENYKGFKITDHRVVFYGICSNCKTK
jgi:Fur family ferric uptake transcriptional regulator